MKLEDVPSIVTLPLLFLSALLVPCLCPLSLMRLLLDPPLHPMGRLIKDMTDDNYEQLVDRSTKPTN
jgi:hypothetical protein